MLLIYTIYIVSILPIWYPSTYSFYQIYRKLISKNVWFLFMIQLYFEAPWHDKRAFGNFSIETHHY